jgi:hypothetical protein
LAAVVLAEMAERKKMIMKAIPKYMDTALTDMYGYFAGPHWRKMDDEDRKRASNIEFMANNTYIKDELDKKCPVWSHLKYDDRYFTVARHTVGRYSVLGMPGLRAQIDPAIPTFSTDGIDFTPLQEAFDELDATRIEAEKEAEKEKK